MLTPSGMNWPLFITPVIATIEPSAPLSTIGPADGWAVDLEIAVSHGTVGVGLTDTIELIGTPDQVADKMGDVMAEVGGDGFLITSPVMRLNRRYITEITDGLVPALQRRGLTRTEYGYDQFRDNLLDF